MHWNHEDWQGEDVLMFRQLPWSTSNEDLVDLFTTIGKVERAEIQYEPNGRSKGTGVVEFDTQENAETAICKSTPFPVQSCGLYHTQAGLWHGWLRKRS